MNLDIMIHLKRNEYRFLPITSVAAPVIPCSIMCPIDHCGGYITSKYQAGNVFRFVAVCKFHTEIIDAQLWARRLLLMKALRDLLLPELRAKIILIYLANN